MVNRYEEYCINDANYFLERAKEAMDASKSDPKAYYEESKEHCSNICKLLPFMVLIQQIESQHLDLGTEESLSDTQSSVQSDEGSYDLEPQPTHLRF